MLSNKKTGGGGTSKVFLIIIIIVIVLGGGGFLVYSQLLKNDSAGGILSAVTGGKVLNPNCKYNDPDLCKFINNWKDIKYLTMTSSSIESGKTSTMTFKMSDSKSQIILSQDGKENYNAITIGETTYTKDYSDNKWWKYTPEKSEDKVSTEDANLNFDEKAEDSEDKTTYEKIGTEACGKLTCFKYKVIEPALSAENSVEYIYFDNKEYILRKTRSETEDGVYEAAYDYTKLDISEPSPVKEGNPFEYNPNDSEIQSVLGQQQNSSSSSANEIPQEVDPYDYEGDEYGDYSSDNSHPTPELNEDTTTSGE